MTEPRVITQEEYIEKYKDVKLKFDYYYKYTFYYEGVAEDGTQIGARFGGCHEEIYRSEYFATQSLANLIDQGAELCGLSIKKPV